MQCLKKNPKSMSFQTNLLCSLPGAARGLKPHSCSSSPGSIMVPPTIQVFCNIWRHRTSVAIPSCPSQGGGFSSPLAASAVSLVLLGAWSLTAAVPLLGASWCPHLSKHSATDEGQEHKELFQAALLKITINFSPDLTGHISLKQNLWKHIWCQRCC